jgi:hypothetical protein
MVPAGVRLPTHHCSPAAPVLRWSIQSFLFIRVCLQDGRGRGHVHGQGRPAHRAEAVPGCELWAEAANRGTDRG